MSILLTPPRNGRSMPIRQPEIKPEVKKIIETAIFSEISLKVSTNEKGGGLKVVAFVRSPFKLISLRFSNISVIL